jgi:two-component system CAI-1 autoinducer sensor kinase/phosphatase CqsS
LFHDRWVSKFAGGAMRGRIWPELLSEQLEPILHPSPWRIRMVGLFTLAGQPLFFWIWRYWLPQPYENPYLRGLVAALGLLLLTPRVSIDAASTLTARVFSAVFFLQLPFFFSWMYFCNCGNTVWLASECAMLLIYYHLTDWRLATLGSVAGGLLAWVLFLAFGPKVPPMSADQAAINAVVIAFSWSCALLLGVSSANLRQEHLRHTLSTMGIMAHELRTPLATAALIADAVQSTARQIPAGGPGPHLEKLAQRLHNLTRHMNHQIDTQIANARLLQLPSAEDPVSARDLVSRVVAEYPYRTSRERACVETVIHHDFMFRSSQALFAQVLDNLIKNALHSLAAANSLVSPGDLRIEVGISGQRGRITVADRGVGIDNDLLPRIFEPFFSTDTGTGHGLGLAFCRQVVKSAGGQIRVRSEPAVGALFTIELPLAS